MSAQGWERYERVRLVGSGSFGRVYLCNDRRQNGTQVAIKIIPVSKVNENTLREVRNHHRLNIHPHVIKFIGTFISKDIIPQEDPRNQKEEQMPQLCIVMEYAEGGSFHKVIARHIGHTQRCLSEDMARWCFQQHMLALHFCHSMQIVNRDIKPDNLLMYKPINIDAFSLQDCLLGRLHNAPILKLADFGYSKAVDWDSNPRSVVGTPTHVAPEILENMSGEISNYDGYKADLWSTGVTLFELLTGTTPFCRVGDAAQHDKIQRILTRAKNLDYRFPTNCNVSQEARDLVGKLLVLNPTQRISLEEVFQHPWFRQSFPMENPVEWTASYVQEANRNTQMKLLEQQELERTVRRAWNLYRIVQNNRYQLQEVQTVDGMVVLRWFAVGGEEEEAARTQENGISSSTLNTQLDQHLQNSSVSQDMQQGRTERQVDVISSMQMVTIREQSNEGEESQTVSTGAGALSGSGFMGDTD